MNKYLKILFGVLLLVAIVEAFIFFSDRLPGGLHACKFPTLSADKKNVGCTSPYSETDFNKNTLLALTIKKVEKKADDVFVTVNFPVFLGLTWPMKMRVGKLSIIKDELGTISGDKKSPICNIMGAQFESGHDCKLVATSDVGNILKPNWFIVVEFRSNDGPLLKDPSYQCRETQAKFVNSVRKNEPFLAFLPYFGKTLCVPTITQIFYGFSNK